MTVTAAAADGPEYTTETGYSANKCRPAHPIQRAPKRQYRRRRRRRHALVCIVSSHQLNLWLLWLLALDDMLRFLALEPNVALKVT